MFIPALIVESRQEPDVPTCFVAAISLGKQRRLPFLQGLFTATCFGFESAAGLGNR
jgi:hypothetical protein